MKLKRDRQPARVALIIFSILVVFCIGQLAWWIIFHIDSGKERRATALDAVRCLSIHMTTVINRDFERLQGMARMILDAELSGGSSRREAFVRLLGDPAMLGYRVTIGPGGEIVENGKVDSTFYAVLDAKNILYFDPHYPLAIIGDDTLKLNFKTDGFHEGAEHSWVKPSMFVISEAWQEQLDEQYRRTTAMFAAETGFFFLVILFGAFMIYRTLSRAEELKFRQQNFIHSVTHELKAPLASIRLYLETIMAGKVEAAKTEKLFPKMIEDCDRLEGLMDNVLEAGHFGKTGYKLKLVQTDLSGDLNHYLDDLERLARRYGGKIDRDIEENIIVESDFQSLRRMVNALVDNAFKYSPADRRQVSVSLACDGQSVRLKVRDRGLGIDSGEQDRIFDRFYRGNVEQSRSAKGTGLGLFLVREIVEAHGGKVTVHSSGLDQGSEFVVRLPLVKS